MSENFPLRGGRKIAATESGQTVGLYLYDPEVAPRDSKGWPVFALRLSDVRPACGSKKSRGGYCESPFRYMNGRCKKHGGASLKGAAHPGYKTGKHSKFRPRGNILENYDRFLRDPEITHHRDAIALTEALLQEVLDQWEEGGTPEVWRRLRELWGLFQVAWNARDHQRVVELITEVDIVVKRGVNQSEREDRAIRLLEAARRHKDSEIKRRRSEEMSLSYEEATAFLTALGTSVRRHVMDPHKTNREKLAAITHDMAAITGARNLQKPPGEPIREGPRA